MDQPRVKTLLVPGGLGFIGSHVVCDLLEQTTCRVVILDDMSNCCPDVLPRLHQILAKHLTAEQLAARLACSQGSILDPRVLDAVFQAEAARGTPIDAIMHFAGKKAVGESFSLPLDYYDNNLTGSLRLLEAMERHPTCKSFVFSSSAGVYGNRDNCQETDPPEPQSPYAETKLCVEMMLAACTKKHPDWRIISLRYFNPCGAHPSHLIGDDPCGFPNNLFPFIQEVIAGRRPRLNVFGSDYPTPDGTCIRDYIHIMDLGREVDAARGHVLALNHLSHIEKPYEVFNLGTGRGYSVLEILKGFEEVLGAPVNHTMAARREGDVPKLVANPGKSEKHLHWRPVLTLKEMCTDSVGFTKQRYGVK